MGQTSVFQIALMIIFALVIGAAVIIFALGGFGADGENNGGGLLGFGTVTVWGTFPQSAFSANMSNLRLADPNLPVMQYTQVDPRYYDQQLAEVLATGGGPDLFFVDETVIRQHLYKITSVSFETFAPRTFKDRFIEGSEIFLFPSATYAIPFGVDPIVLYWNRDMLNAAGFTAPPQYWDQMYDYVKAITKRSPDGLDISHAAVALGDYRNIDHAKEILSILLMQAGARITYVDGQDKMKTDLNLNYEGRPLAAIRYYTEFSNPASAAYTWNRAMPSSRDAFLGNQLALYFGYASELRFLREANPNLNFDMALVPQPRDLARPITYGKMTGLAISRMSQNKQGALALALGLTGANANVLMTGSLGIASVRRDMLATAQTDPWWATTYRSALNAQAWYQPGDYFTDLTFQTMIDSIVSGTASLTKAFQTATQDLSGVLD